MLNTITIQDKLRVIEWLYPEIIGDNRMTKRYSAELLVRSHKLQVMLFGGCMCQDIDGRKDTYPDCEVSV